jgi:hypothetical protein
MRDEVLPGCGLPVDEFRHDCPVVERDARLLVLENVLGAGDARYQHCAENGLSDHFFNSPGAGG